MKQNFIFKSYDFSADSKMLRLQYSADNITFTESYKFDFDYVDYDKQALDRAIQILFFMAGVSYYKAFVPSEISIERGELTKENAKFLSKTYQNGLGEFFYVNKLDPKTPTTFPFNAHNLEPIKLNNNGLLIGVGGGKDSLVSIEILRDQPKVATWSVGHKSQLEPLVERIGLPHFWVERSIDKQLLELNKNGALNGHVPISAILSTVGLVVAILTGHKDIIVSNESSANEPTLTYEGVEINHQYSKSITYERDFQRYLLSAFGESVRYYSFLRPLSEVYIAEIFAKIGYEKYKDVFSSCNRAFTQNQTELFWCGECAKCAFIYLALTPFLPSGELKRLFSGRDLLTSTNLEPIYKNILGIDGVKPLDCVGEIKESRWAMNLASKIHPELKQKYHFDLPENYIYNSLSNHNMPQEIYQILTDGLNKL